MALAKQAPRSGASDTFLRVASVVKIEAVSFVSETLLVHLGDEVMSLWNDTHYTLLTLFAPVSPRPIPVASTVAIVKNASEPDLRRPVYRCPARGACPRQR